MTNQNQEMKHSKSAVLGLQHLLAMYSGSILVPIMIAGALGYSSKELTYLISTDIFMCGVATFLQLQVNKYFGIGLPVVLGVAFQSVAPIYHRCKTGIRCHIWVYHCIRDYRHPHLWCVFKSTQILSATRHR